MSSRASSSTGWFVLIAAFLLPIQAKAWIETSVHSHQARVEVEADGRATIRHELVLKVRGGPMQFLEIPGIGTDIQALPDAQVSRATEGSTGKWPLTVSALEDGGVRLGIGADRGIRGGSYLFSFAYEVDLKALGLISKGPQRSEISWIGPRLSSGVDTAKVVFVLPRSVEPPKLLQVDEAGGEVLLGELRRGESLDEVELVRAHLAVGEPAVWKIEVDSAALGGVPLSSTATQTTLSDEAVRLSGRAAGLHSGAALFRLLSALGLSLVYGLLVFFKARWLRDETRSADAMEKPLLPGTPWFRGLCCGGLVFSGAHSALNQEPWIAVCLAGLALVNTTHLLPTRVVKARGPGRWVPITSEPPSAIVARSPAVFFEITTLRGFLFLVALMLPLIALSYRILPSSNYLALMTLIFALLLVPLFWTGRLRDLPQAPAQQARPWLRTLAQALDPKVATVELWGRVPAIGDGIGTSEENQRVDEARVRIVLARIPPGLRSLEISFEESAGSGVAPCVVLRVVDDSAVKDRLPAEIPWQRGRSSDERVTLLRPAAPTRAQLLRLVRSLVSNLRGTAQLSQTESAPSSKARRSAGSFEAALNDSKVSPVQAM